MARDVFGDDGTGGSAPVTPTGPGGPFDALTIPGLICWYRAEVHPGADGDKVSGLKDLGPIGAHLSQGDTTKQPILKRNIVGTRAVLRFDGTNDFLQSGALATRLLPPMTCFAVINGGGNRYFVGSDAGVRFGWNANGPNTYCGTGTNGSGGTVGWHVVVSEYTGTTATITLDGAAFITAQAEGGNTFGPGIMMSQDSQPWTGDIAEILLYSGLLSTPNKATIRLGLESYYSITGT